ncbi:MAG: DUF1573 domain-containing protein [Planctomycetota bacterium]
MTFQRFLRSPIIAGAAAVAVVAVLAVGQTALAQAPNDPGQESGLQKKADPKKEDQPNADRAAAQPRRADAKASAPKTQRPRLGKAIQGPPSPKEKMGDQGAKSARPLPQAPRRSPAPKPTVVLKPGEIPAIVFDTPVWDFGRIRAGFEVTHEFWFTNTGTGPLEILRVKPG